MENYPIGHPFWLYVPEKGELENDPENALMDLFNVGHCFLNDFRRTPCHPDSYMTILDYEAADKVFDIIQAEFSLSKETWLEFCDFWEYHINKQPITCMLAMHVRRKISKK